MVFLFNMTLLHFFQLIAKNNFKHLKLFNYKIN